MKRATLTLALLFASACAQQLSHDTAFEGRLVVRSASTTPSCAGALGKGDVCIEDDLQLGGTLSGAMTKVIAGGVAYTATAADCGAIVETATDNAILTLPAVAAGNAGCSVTLRNTGADGAALVSLSPNAADAIFGSCVGITGAGAATVVQSGGVDDKDFRNTKATANKGDTATVTSDGVTGWYLSGCVGEWVSE